MASKFIVKGFSSVGTHISNMSVRCFCAIATRTSPQTGIVLMNMGGPRDLTEVGTYLTKIMTDTEMIQLPLQSVLGRLIAKYRTGPVKRKYDDIGGGSPIFDWTNKQGKLMCEKLDEISPETAPHKHYIAFRYTDPSTEDAIKQIEWDGVKRVVLFSQYPQYSCSTSGSSFNAFYTYFSKKSEMPNHIKWSVIDRWSTNPYLIKTFADRITKGLEMFPDSMKSKVVIVFSAHSLPLLVVKRGDTYPAEVGYTVNAVMKELNFCNPYVLSWQSSVGPAEWLSPFTYETVHDLAWKGHMNFLVVPIAFVNEHIETLHELDMELVDGIRNSTQADRIIRVDAPNVHPLFIDAMADEVVNSLRNTRNVPINPKFLMRCPHCTSDICCLSKSWYEALCRPKDTDY